MILKLNFKNTQLFYYALCFGANVSLKTHN